jgi:hypothetical protein
MAIDLRQILTNMTGQRPTKMADPLGVWGIRRYEVADLPAFSMSATSVTVKLLLHSVMGPARPHWQQGVSEPLKGNLRGDLHDARTCHARDGAELAAGT